MDLDFSKLIPWRKSSTSAEASATENHQEGGDEEKTSGIKKFGTFYGVFCPTVLTLLGAMIYLRQGWVVGHAGLGGTLLIVLMAFVITGTTAFSVSSITTNIQVGAGGVFSIVSQSLGLEVGGSVGIAYYIAQMFSTALYIYGFVEGWRYLYPTHPALLIAIILFILIFLASYLSTTLAFRIQLLILGTILASFVSIFMGLEHRTEFQPIQWWGDFEGHSYWILFAIFFPAATDIMVGASMSGSLKNPRKSIPRGTLASWGMALVIYVGMAAWYSLVASPEELQNNFLVSVDQAFWKPVVLAGILLSCIAAALSSLVSAPPILQSLASYHMIPYSRFFSKTHNGEPRNAMLFTAGCVLAVLFLEDLNIIAELLTMFFLMTYFMVNSVLLIEQQLNLLSFRPAIRIPTWVPLLGSISCLFAMVIISPFWGLLAVLMSVGIYFYLDRRGLEAPGETVHSGLFIGLANWSAKKVMKAKTSYTRRSWKPDLLMMIERRTQFEGHFSLLRSLVYPQGSVHLVGLMQNQDIMPLLGLKHVIRDMQDEGVFISSVIVNSEGYVKSLAHVVDFMKGSLFHPNTIFESVEDRSSDELAWILEEAETNTMGVVFYAAHPETGLGRSRTINVWIRDQSPDWLMEYSLSNLDLTLLLALKLMQNWNATLRIITVVEHSEDMPQAQKALEDFMNAARFPSGYTVMTIEGTFPACLEEHSPRADLNILGMPEVVTKESLHQLVMQIKSSCFFVRDSGVESVLA